MASARALRAGKAVIELSLLTGDVEKQLKRLQARMRDFGTKLKSYGSMGLAVSGAIAAPLIASIKFAGDAQESLSRFGAVFGEQTAAANEFAEALAKSVGRSSIDIKDGLASFQAFFVGLGFGGKEARQFSEQLSTLAIDFASFNNMADAEAQQRFISALSGSSEVLDMYGINIKQAALEQQLLSQGVNKAWTDVTEQEKAIARLNIIMKSMGDQGAVGDAVRTQGSFANQLKRLQGAAKDVGITIGNALIPKVTAFLQWSNEVAKRIGEWASANGDLIRSVGETAAKVAVAAGAIVLFGTVLSAAAVVLNPYALAVGGLVGAYYLLDKAVQKFNETLGTQIKTLELLFPQLAILKNLLPEGTIDDFKASLPDLSNIKMPEIKVPEFGKDLAPFAIPSAAQGVDTVIGNKVGEWTRAIQRAAQGPISEARFRFGQVQQGLEFGKEFGAARQNVDDEIARERIMQMKDEVAQRTALIKFETQLKMRELQTQGFLNEEMKAKLMALEGIQLAGINSPLSEAQRASESFFDAKNIVQSLGGRDNYLKEIAGNTRKMANKKDNPGLPIV